MSDRETTLFEDLERIQNSQEQEDLQTLAESDEDKEEAAINKTQVNFIDDGKIDYDAKSSLNFKIGEEAKHFGLNPEELDRFSEICEEHYRLLLSQTVYDKSLKDQVKQKGIKVNIDRATAVWEGMLDRVCGIKMLDFICDLVKVNDDIKKQIISREIEKYFGPQNNQTVKKDTTQSEILGQLQYITHSLRKRM